MEDAQHRATRPFSSRNGPVRQPLGTPSVPGAVEQGVQTAYTVIDAHLQRGRQEAERLRQSAQGFTQSFNGGPSPSPWADAGWGSGARSTDPFPSMGAGAAPSSPALMGALLQMMQAWGAGLAALTPLVAQVAANAASAANAAVPQQPTQPHASQAPHAPHAPRAQLSVELLSKRLGEVSVSLEPGADMETLRAVFATPPGTGTDTQGPMAEFYAAPGQVRVRLNATEHTVAGRHEATVLDQTGRPWGQVSIVVSPLPVTDPWVQP